MQTLIAAPFGVGVALCHVMSSGEELPIIYASRTMSKAKTNNAQLDREALSVSSKTPTKSIQQMSSPRMQRWALTLSAYSYTLKHIRGPENTLAGTLRMLPIVENSP